jgi:SPP1 family predicted phage head-tail adaptor
MIDPGQMRTKLVYQERTLAKNTFGGVDETWQDVATVWAKVEPLSGRKLFYARQLHDATTHSVTCRYDGRIKTVGRLSIHGTGRVLKILGVLDAEERRIELTINCLETDGAPA